MIQRTGERTQDIKLAREKLAAGESKESVEQFINTDESFAPLFLEEKSVRTVQLVPVEAAQRAKTVAGVLAMVKPGRKAKA